jgi:hypothetical protein
MVFKKYLFVSLTCMTLTGISLGAEQTKTVFNPFTGNPDFITRLDSTTLPSGSTQYIQNNPLTVQTATMSITGQAGFDNSVFNVYNATPTMSTQGQIKLAFDASASLPCLWMYVNGQRWHMCGCPDSGPANNSGQCAGLLCGVTYP